jgi:hypothetical protein
MVGDVMCLGDGEVRVDGGVDLGAQDVPDPSDVQIADVADSGNT